MTFKDLHLNQAYRYMTNIIKLIKELMMDKRLRTSIILLMISTVLICISFTLYLLQSNHLNTAIIKLASQTQEIIHRLDVRKQQSKIPQFETSMKAIGAYNPPITGEQSLSHVTNCFLQKNKPSINITQMKEAIESLYIIQSLNIEFKSSFDYEIFDMMAYIFSNPDKFGYTRLREFEIEQLFETSPVVKGRFMYDQLSLKQ